MQYSETVHKILNEYEEIKQDMQRIYKHIEFDKSQIQAEDIDLQWVIGCLNPESQTYGNALGLFVYEPDERVFLFHYTIHRPESKGPHRSNQMTSIEEVIWKENAKCQALSGIRTRETSFGPKAFWMHTPMDCLNQEEQSLRQLMMSVQAYCRKQDYCAKLRKLDKKHIAWEEERVAHHNLKMEMNTGAGVRDELKGGQ